MRTDFIKMKTQASATTAARFCLVFSHRMAPRLKRLILPMNGSTRARDLLRRLGKKLGQARALLRWGMIEQMPRLPAKCPDLNVMENLWQFMRDNWLSDRVFTDHENVVAHCCHHRDRLTDQPWRFMSIG